MNFFEDLLEAADDQESPPSDRDVKESVREAKARRAKIVSALFDGKKGDEIAAECGVSKSTVYRVRRRLVKYGSPTEPRDGGKARGRPKKVTAEDEEALLKWLLEDGWHSYKEIANWLRDERGLTVTSSTAFICCKRNGWTEEVIDSMREERTTAKSRAKR